MKVIQAARFSGIVFLVTAIFTYLFARTGLRLVGVQLPRQVWVTENVPFWMAVNWLWLLVVFSWMVVMVALMWSYSPSHRISSMLQSGLTIISAVLLILGIVIWMNLLPFGAGREDAIILLAFIDTLVLSLFGAGFFMGGVVTAWIGVDLIRLNVLPTGWMAPLFLVGLCWLPSPFVLPRFELLALGFLIWIGWCLFIGTRRTLPSAYAEWT